MPSAPVAFSAGIISRATDSSMIVSTAIHPLPLNPETVGLRKAGSFFNTYERFFSSILNFIPTLVSASSAPRSNIATFSILFRFQLFSQLSLLEISRGVEERSSSIMRSLLATRLDPVSVTSTIASTNSRAFTSVAPHENST